VKTKCLFLLASGAALACAQMKFYADDPLQREPAPVHVEAVLNRKLSDHYDLFSHQFGSPGQRQPKTGSPIKARAVNTLGEPMDGAWYEKRHYYRRMTLEELKRGPGDATPPAKGKWTVVGAKAEGITPGFTILDENRRRYFIKFDPLTNPEMATAADSISSRFFYALGYHVPENYMVTFTPEQLELGDNIQLSDATGKKRKMTSRDLYEILVKVPKTRDGRYRATASLALPGKPVGPPRYYGTRKDDPNDTVPHEHRRDQRGLHVFCAWLAHDDSRAINNMDVLVLDNGRQFLRHYLLDFGSTLGSGSQKANSPRSGAYFFGWKSSAKQLFTLGLAPPYWQRAAYEAYPSIGLFEGNSFDPEQWVAEYPNPAFLNRLPDDEFWAAKQVMAFRDDEIRAIVSTGRLSDKKAEEYLIRCLIKRRDRIGRSYLAKVLPFDRFRFDAADVLVWDDLSDSIRDATVHWYSFDNATGAKTPAKAPPAPGSGYAMAEIVSPSRPRQTIQVYVRGREVVGVERTW
jgi:hypothetical protein